MPRGRRTVEECESWGRRQVAELLTEVYLNHWRLKPKERIHIYELIGWYFRGNGYDGRLPGEPIAERFFDPWVLRYLKRPEAREFVLGLFRKTAAGWVIPLLPDPSAARPPIPESVRRAIFERDGRVCVVCGAEESLEIDHVFPWSLGGEHDPTNLRVLCKPCNLKKRDRVEI